MNAAVDSIARIAEVEACTPGSSGSSGGGINYLVTDQLGTPRMVFDQSGSLATTKRHDYAPFGEELFNGSRTTAMGYAANDTTRQQFTEKERDGETGLDYSINRYYVATQGRFTSADPLVESGDPKQPQSWNRFAYVINDPLQFTDPDGLRYVQRKLADGTIQYGWCSTEQCYNDAIDKDSKSYQGWTPVTFDESQPFEFFTTGIGGDHISRFRLNTNGTWGYTADLEDRDLRITTDWTAQFAIAGMLRTLFGALGSLVDAGAAVAVSQSSTQTSLQAGSKLEVLITAIEKEIAGSGAKTMTQRALAINKVLGQLGLKAVGRYSTQGIRILSKGEITTIAKDGTVTITKRATGEVIKQIK